MFYEEATVLDTVQKAVAQQEKQVADLTKTLADQSMRCKWAKEA